MRNAIPIAALMAVSISAFAADAPQTDAQDNAQPNPPVHVQSTPLVVTGTWEPVELDDADRPVQVYPLPDMPLLYGNVMDALSLDSSANVQSRGPIQADVSIRGASFGQTLFLLDGQRINDVQSAHYNSDLPVPLDAIDRIEVLRGSGSTLYGSDAIGGVVNILTQPPDIRNSLELVLRGGAGNFGTNEESGFIDGVLGTLSERISVERDFSTGFINDRDYRNSALSSQSWVKSTLGLTRVFLGIDDRPFGADQFYGPYSSWERTKTWLADVSQDLGKNTTATFSYRRHTDLFELFRTDPSFYTNNHIDDQFDYSLRRHDSLSKYAHVYYGAEGLNEHVNSNNLGVHSRNEGAVYADVDLRAVRRASLSIGAREEFYSGYHGVFSPNASGGYWLSSKAKLRGSISEAFRLPTFTDLYYHDPANIGNPLLQPEKAWSYEGGADWHVRDRWVLSFTAFQRHDRNDIDYVRADSNAIWQAMNFDQLTFTGLEASANLSLPQAQTVGIEFTGLEGNQTALAGMQSKYVFNYPTQQAVVSWQRLSPAGWVARIRTGVANQYDRSAYLVMDASAAWTRSRFHPYLRLTNLTDTSYQPVYGIPMPGRAFVAGLEICAICKSK